MNAHMRDCLEVRRRNETKLDDIAEDLKTLLSQSSEAKGRSTANAVLLGGIPNALWSVVIQGLGTLIAAGVVLVGIRMWH